MTIKDLENLHMIFSDVESMKYYPKPFTLQETKNWINWNIENYSNYGFGLWCVILKENDQLIGDCGITLQKINNNMEPELGYHINKNYLNKGYATEAAQACRDYAFENFKFKKIYSYMKYSNIASVKVAEKVGMKLENELKDENNGITKIYAITFEEYQNNVKSYRI